MLSKTGQTEAFEVKPERESKFSPKSSQLVKLIGDGYGDLLHLPISVSLPRYLGQDIFVVVVPEVHGIIGCL